MIAKLVNFEVVFYGAVQFHIKGSLIHFRLATSNWSSNPQLSISSSLFNVLSH